MNKSVVDWLNGYHDRPVLTSPQRLSRNNYMFVFPFDMLFINKVFFDLLQSHSYLIDFHPLSQLYTMYDTRLSLSCTISDLHCWWI